MKSTAARPASSMMEKALHENLGDEDETLHVLSRNGIQHKLAKQALEIARE